MTEIEDAPRYKAFLSYSWKDKDAAAALHRALESFRMPKSLIGRQTRHGPAPEKLHPIFRDREEQAAGADLKVAIEAALDRSDSLIVVCSPNAAASPWVNKEVAYFRKKRDPARVFSYVIAGEPGASAIAGRAMEECFPPALRFETSVDGTATTEPIGQPLAADARPEGDGVRAAQMKIVAAVLGVGLDELVRRDLERRAREQRRIALVAGSVAAAMTGVALYAVAQRDRAIDNARLAQREAMTAQRTADFMVSLFEVANPDEQSSRDIKAETVLRDGVARIERDLKDEAAVQGALMDAMGRSYIGLGYYDEAARVLAAALDKRVTAKAESADVYATERALARATFEMDDLPAAKSMFSKLVASAEANIARGDFQLEYVRALAGLGETVLYSDDPQSGPHVAIAHFERARDLLKSHGLGESDDMGRVFRGLGVALTFAGEYAEGIAQLKKAEAHFQARGESQGLTIAKIENDLAAAYYAQRRIDLAADSFEASLREQVRILGIEHPDSLITENNFARMLIEAGSIDKARSILGRFASEVEKNPKLEHPGAPYFFNNYGLALAESNQHESALRHFETASKKVDSGSARIAPEIGLNTGRSLCATRQSEAGLDAVALGRKRLGEIFPDDDWRFGVADEFESRCLAVAGERDRAKELAQSAYERLSAELTDRHYFARRAKAWRDSISKLR